MQVENSMTLQNGLRVNANLNMMYLVILACGIAIGWLWKCQQQQQKRRAVEIETVRDNREPEAGTADNITRLSDKQKAGGR